jgi:hypothetical protein
MERTAIYTRNHDAHAWQFDRQTTPEAAELAGATIPGDTQQVLLVTTRSMYFAFPSLLDSAQPQYEADAGNDICRIVRVK